MRTSSPSSSDSRRGARRTFIGGLVWNARLELDLPYDRTTSSTGQFARRSRPESGARLLAREHVLASGARLLAREHVLSSGRLIEAVIESV